MSKGKRTTGARKKPFGPRERRVVALLARGENPTAVARLLGDVRRQLVYEIMRRPEYPEEFARARHALAVEEGAGDGKALEVELARAKLAGDLNAIVAAREKLARNRELLENVQVQSRAEQMHKALGGGDSPAHGIRAGLLDDPERYASLRARGGYLSHDEKAEMMWLASLPRSRRYWRIENELRLASIDALRLRRASDARGQGRPDAAEQILRALAPSIGTPLGPPLHIPLDVAADLLRQHSVEPTTENIDRIVAQHVELELRRLAPMCPRQPLDAVVPWGDVATGEIVAVEGERRPTPPHWAPPKRKVNGWWVRPQLYDAAFADVAPSAEPSPNTAANEAQE
jgi:hypothetical protein